MHLRFVFSRNTTKIRDPKRDSEHQQHKKFKKTTNFASLSLSIAVTPVGVCFKVIPRFRKYCVGTILGLFDFRDEVSKDAFVFIVKFRFDIILAAVQ